MHTMSHTMHRHTTEQHTRTHQHITSHHIGLFEARERARAATKSAAVCTACHTERAVLQLYDCIERGTRINIVMYICRCIHTFSVLDTHIQLPTLRNGVVYVFGCRKPCGNWTTRP